MYRPVLALAVLLAPAEDVMGEPAEREYAVAEKTVRDNVIGYLNRKKKEVDRKTNVKSKQHKLRVKSPHCTETETLGLHGGRAEKRPAQC